MYINKERGINMTKEELKNECIRLYDLYTMKTEKRGISYGEIVWIESINEKDYLIALEETLIEEVEE